MNGTALPDLSPLPSPPSALQLPDLVRYAREQTGEFLERHRRIVREAFSRHTLLLNARQLRELAGGGSQTTAQRAIEEFRAELGAKVSHRIRLGADVPEPVLQGATDLLETLWILARDQAVQQFDEDRRTLREQAEQAHLRVEELEVARGELAQELAVSTRSLAAGQADIQRLGRELEQAQAERDTERRARTEQQARHESQLEQLGRESRDAQAQLSEQLAQMRQQRDHAQQALETQQRDAAHRFDRLLIEQREALGVARREGDDKLARVRRELQAVRDKHEAASEAAITRVATLEAAAASSAERVQHLQRAEQDLQSRLQELQAHNRELQTQSQALLVQNRELLAQIQGLLALAAGAGAARGP